eukprot:TRINITY_DN25361_c0_g1_i2.p1 TRINITY_DN25361_c0_g1~~TRINITY_DN25361_c0_g1_i2.p1  ORF type:complete len:684 (+),score=92.06 TRINITY_DN25361_c0_g1_i2:93-2054(+)
MRETADEVRLNAKMAERRHWRDNIRETLTRLQQRLRDLEASAGHGVRRLAFLPEKLQLLDEKHVTTVVDAVSTFLQSLVRSGVWTVYRTKKYHRNVRICQRTIRRWLGHLREKIEWVVYIWASNEAADQHEDRIRRSKRAGRSAKQALTSAQDMYVDYFNCWVPKDLKTAVVRDCYRKKLSQWRQAFADWKRAADSLRAQQNQRKGLLRKLHRAENRVRHLAGAAPVMVAHRSSLSEANVMARMEPQPTLHWFEETLCELSLMDLVVNAYERDRLCSAQRLAAQSGIPFVPPAGDMGQALKVKTKGPPLVASFQRLNPPSHAVLMRVFSSGSTGTAAAGHRAPPASPTRRVRVVDNFCAGSASASPSPSPRRAASRQSLDEATARAILMGSSDLSTVRSLADAQAREKFVQRRFSEGLKEGGIVAARAAVEHVRRESGMTGGTVFCSGGWFVSDRSLPRAPRRGLSRLREQMHSPPSVSHRDEKGLLLPVYYFTGACCFDGCACKMYKQVGKIPLRGVSGEPVCAHCGHWCRYHGAALGHPLSESSLQHCSWCATVSFVPPRLCTDESTSPLSPKGSPGAAKHVDKSARSSSPLPARQKEARPFSAPLSVGSFFASPLFRAHVAPRAAAAQAASGRYSPGPPGRQSPDDSKQR